MLKTPWFKQATVVKLNIMGKISPLIFIGRLVFRRKTKQMSFMFAML